MKIPKIPNLVTLIASYNPFVPSPPTPELGPKDQPFYNTSKKNSWYFLGYCKVV